MYSFKKNNYLKILVFLLCLFFISACGGGGGGGGEEKSSSVPEKESGSNDSKKVIASIIDKDLGNKKNLEIIFTLDSEKGKLNENFLAFVSDISDDNEQVAEIHYKYENNEILRYHLNDRGFPFKIIGQDDSYIQYENIDYTNASAFMAFYDSQGQKTCESIKILFDKSKMNNLLDYYNSFTSNNDPVSLPAKAINSVALRKPAGKWLDYSLNISQFGEYVAAAVGVASCVGSVAAASGFTAATAGAAAPTYIAAIGVCGSATLNVLAAVTDISQIEDLSTYADSMSCASGSVSGCVQTVADIVSAAGADSADFAFVYTKMNKPYLEFDGDKIIIKWNDFSSARSYNLFLGTDNDLSDDLYETDVKSPYVILEIDRTKTFYIALQAVNNDSLNSSMSDYVVIPAKGEKIIWYRDLDGDGFGDNNNSLKSYDQPSGYVLQSGDCDDNNPSINPGAEELCGDNIDNNCNGQIDEGCNTYYKDADGDGYGDPDNSISAKTKPAGYVTDNTDFDDTDKNSYPGAEEICGDGKDNNNNGLIDEGCPTVYKKLDKNGSELQDSADSWAMVKDEKTGLVWEVKTNDDSIHDRANKYKFENLNSEFISKLNEEKFGGYQDWRMPTMQELGSIVVYDGTSRAVNEDYFPNTVTSCYWSSKESVNDPEEAYYIHFEYGNGGPATKTNTYFARAVRGPKFEPSFTDLGDGTVKDNTSGLIWTKERVDINNDGSLDESDAVKWEDAVSHASNYTFAGQSDWRLPSPKELRTILDYNKYAPCIDTSIFPDDDLNLNNLGTVRYWTSYEDPEDTDYAWEFNLRMGSDGTVTKSFKGLLRLVSGQSGSNNPVVITGGTLPDTGQTKCYDNSGNVIPCPSPGEEYYGQDGCYTINPPSYTKLDSTGNALPDSAQNWVMVKDNVTCLIWEVKTDDGSVHDKDNTYTWYDAHIVFIAELNNSNFGGYSDWRMPTVKELRSIVDYGRYAPAIDTNFFPDTMSWDYWSSTNVPGYSYHNWFVDFDNGHDVKNDNKSYNSSAYYIRAVRGGQ